MCVVIAPGSVTFQGAELCAMREEINHGICEESYM